MNLLFSKATMAMLCMAATAAATRAHAETFRYILRDVPAQTGMNCDDVAHSWGQRLGQSGSDVRVTETRCFDDDTGDGYFPAWDMEFTYEAAKLLTEISTEDRGSSTIERGGFKDRAKCEQALAAELPLFESKTGLAAVYKFCRVPMFRESPWEVSIISFGEPAVRPYTLSTELLGTFLGQTLASFTEMVRERLEGYGATMSQLMVQSNPGYLTLMVRYYGDKRIRVDETPLAKYETVGACAADLAAGQMALDVADLMNLGAYCHRISFGDEIELVALTQREGPLAVVNVAQIFPDRAACQSAKTKILEHYRDQLGRAISGALCSLADDGTRFQVRLIEKRRMF